MKLLIASLTILAVVGLTAAIKCFICNSQLDSACNNAMQADSGALIHAFVEECPVKDNMTMPFCRKVVEHMHHAEIVRVHRECGYLVRGGYVCYQKRAEDYVMDVCQCDTDLCNGTPALKAPLASLLAVAFPLLTRFM